MRRSLIIILIGLIVLTQPVLVQAQIEDQIASDCIQGRFIPCDGTDKCPCGFNSFIILINNVLKFAVEISFPLAVIVFTYAGFKFMIDRGKGKDAGDAKNMMWNVVWGFVIILSSWLIVRTVLEVLLKPEIIQNLPIKL